MEQNQEAKNEAVSPNSHEDHQNHLKRIRHKRLKKIILSLFSVSIFFFLTTLYSQYQVYVLKKLDMAHGVSQEDIATTPNQIVEAVSRHILLPDTTPQIAAVQDAQKLSTSQVFFKDAVNGDVVLVYETLIIVYRPSQDIVVAVGDISGGTPK